MGWREQRYEIYKFIMQTWKNKVKAAELKLMNALTEEEKKEAKISLDSLKRNVPNPPLY